MTTPSTLYTVQRVITSAYLNAGLSQEDEVLSGQKFAIGLEKLTDLINFKTTKGLKLFLNQDVSVPLTAGKAMYSLGIGGDVNMPKPIRVIDSCYYLDTNNQSRQIFPISRQEYNQYSSKVTTGSITSYYVDKQLSSLNVYFWNTPDSTCATGVAHLVVVNQAPQIVSLTDQISFPPEWAVALIWGLADELCTGQPQETINRCERKAIEYFTQLEDNDVEDASTYFQPDYRGQNVSQFR